MANRRLCFYFTPLFWKSCVFFLTIGLLMGCSMTASERMADERSKVRAHPAAFAADSFYLGTGEDRKPNSQDGSGKKFYFKDCELVSRKRFPVRAEYECSRE